MLKLLCNKATSRSIKAASSTTSIFTQSQRMFRASQPMNQKFNVYIDGKPVQVDASYTIFQACTEAGVEIPRFCYHERLSVAGNCRMCLVEVEGAPKPIASCATNVRPDLKVITKSEKTRIARGGVMEFLLANHPLDCPICDQGGECDLQDISMVYGYTEGRMMEYKRAVEDKNFGPLIKTSMTRCIHCTRCVRFTEQIAGEFTLGQFGRGKSNEISAYIENFVTNELSGNVIDLCPVGALNNLPYSFKARPWELKSNYSVDVMDAVGSNIDIHTRGSEAMRILPRVNEEVNEEWISDKARWAFDGLQRQRLHMPFLRQKDGSFAELKWEEALDIAAKKLTSVNGDEIQGMIGPFMDLEAIVAFRDLLHKLGSENIDVRANQPHFNADFRSQYLMNSKIVGIDETDLLLLVGCNPRLEAPVLNARIRKAQIVNGLQVGIIGSATNLGYEYTHLGNTATTLQQIADGIHPFSERLAKAELPLILLSADALQRQDGEAILNYLNKLGKNSNVINLKEKWNGINILHNEASRPGALDLGIIPKKELAGGKKAKVVYILGSDNFRHEDIPEDAFVIYQGHTGDEGAYYADLILPGAAYIEKSATYVNTDGRPQQIRAALAPPGWAREDWHILRALSEETKTPLPYDSLDEVRTRMAELAPHLVKFDYIESSGFEGLAHKFDSNKTQLNRTPLTENIDNFYQTDAISRNSLVMARCTKELNPLKQFNFKEHVQGWMTH